MVDIVTLKKNAIKEVIEREGGSKYTNRAADLGGPTRWGVTEKTARAVGYKGAMQDYPYDGPTGAEAVYSSQFWDFCKCSDIAQYSQELAVWMFDYAVNSGPPRAIDALQTLLNVLNNRGKLYPDFAPAANIGPKTLTALAAYSKVRDIKILAYSFNGLRIAFLVNLAKSSDVQEENIYGWLNRVVNITKNVGI